jgi:hypothetical protein
VPLHAKTQIIEMLKKQNTPQDIIDFAVDKMYSVQEDLSVLRNFISNIKDSKNPIIKVIYEKIAIANVAIENEVMPRLRKLMNISQNHLDQLIQRVNGEVTGDFLHMYNRNAIEEYKNDKKKEFAKKINEEFGTELKEDFTNTDLKSLSLPADSIKIINDRYETMLEKIKEDIEILPMNDEYYATQIKMSRKAKGILRSINQDKYRILEKYINPATGTVDMKKVSVSDKISLNKLESKKKMHASEFNIYGERKTGEELEVAKELQAYSKAIQEKFKDKTPEDVNRSAEAFAKFKAEYDSLANMSEDEKIEWLKDNANIRFPQEFYEEFSAARLKKDVSRGIISSLLQIRNGASMTDAEFLEEVNRLKQDLAKPYRKSSFMSEFNAKDIPVEVINKLSIIQKWLNDNTEREEGQSSSDIELNRQQAEIEVNKGYMVWGKTKIDGKSKSVKVDRNSNLDEFTEFWQERTRRIPSSQWEKDLKDAEAKGVGNVFKSTHGKVNYYTKTYEPNFYYARSVPNIDMNENEYELGTENGLLTQKRTSMKMPVRIMGNTVYVVATPNGYWFDRSNMKDMSNPLFNKEMAGRTAQYKPSITETIDGVQKTYNFYDDNYFTTFGIDKSNPFGEATTNRELWSSYQEILRMKEMDDKKIGKRYAYFELPQVAGKVNKIDTFKQGLATANAKVKNLFSITDIDDESGELEENIPLISVVDAKTLFRNKKPVEYKNAAGVWTRVSSAADFSSNTEFRKAPSSFGVSKVDYKTRKVVPIYYTKRLDPSLISTDLLYSMSKYSFMASNFYHKSKIMPDITQLTSAVDYQTYGDTNNIKGAESNEKKSLEAFVSMEMFGAQVASDTVFNIGDTKFSMNKTMRLLAGAIRALNLSYKTAVPVTGAASGAVQSLVEAHGGKYFDFNDYSRAHSMFMGNIGGIISDSGELIGDSEVNRLIEYLGMGDTRGIVNEMGESKIFRMLSGAGYLAYKITDYTPKAIATLASTNNHRIIDMGDGQYTVMNKTLFFDLNKVDKNGVVRERESIEKEWAGMLPMLDVLGVNNEGLPYSKNSSIDLSDINNFQEAIRSINKASKQSYSNLTGNVEQSEKPYLYHHPALQALGMHKSWLFNTFSIWFRPETVDFATGQMDRGLFFELISAFNSDKSAFLKQIISLNQLGNDSTLTENQRYALRKATSLLYMIGGTLLLAMMMNKAADDDDDDALLQYTAFISLKLFTETFGASPIGVGLESYVSYTDPMGSLKAGKDVVSTLPDAFFGDDEIKQGKFKGLTERRRLFIRMMPFLKNGWYSHVEIGQSRKFFRDKVLPLHLGDLMKEQEQE